MTSKISPLDIGVRRLSVPLMALLTAAVCSAQQAATPAAPQPAKEEEAIVLTPFVVDATKDKGYYAENTLAGSRIRTNLSDLAASITVVTKQQMEDTAALDINDVFKYEASTEGSSTYTPSIVDRGTAKDALAGYSFGNNGDTTTNAQSNRIRGLAAPDAAINNYSSNNRIPLDSYNTQSIEISRGPNSLLFGLGSPSGVVNQNPTQAVLNRNSNSVVMRTDQNGSFRGSLTFNRSLIDDKLAIFGAVLYDDKQFERKPSYDRYRRQFAAITYKPLKNTTIRAFAEGYRNDANRPNFMTPRDQVTPWLNAGRPSYDPTTRMVTIQDTGVVMGPYVTDTRSPGYVATVNRILGANALSTLTSPLFVPGIAFDDVTRPLRRIDTSGNTIDFFQRSNVFYRQAHTNPQAALDSATSLGWTANDPRFLIADRMWSASANLPIPAPTVNGKPGTYGSYNYAGVTNQSIYDWTKYNTLHTNFANTKAANYNLEFEQQILPNLFFSAGWFRQDIDEVDNYTVNQLTGATLSVDTNVKKLDGSPNPYFGLPYISEGVGGGLDTFRAPETDDNYRAMLAYEIDLTKKDNWMRWLGHHRIVGAWSEQDVLKAVERWRLNFTNDSDLDGRLRYAQNLTLANQNASLNSAIMRKYYMANPGDPQATVTQSIGSYGNRGWDSPISSPVQVWNYNTGQYQYDQVVEEGLFSQAGSFRTQRQVQGKQIALQSYLWDDRLITTLGWRHDSYRARITTSGALTDITGKVYEPGFNQDRLYTNGYTGLIDYDRVMNRWTRWDKLDGSTKTLGGAFRPFKDLGFARRLGGEGSIASEFVQGLTFYYNQSDNFNPPSTYQTDYFFRPLAKPTGKTKEYGVGFNILQNKLVARLNWYETTSANERTSSANTLLTRLAYQDTTTGIPWASAVQRIRNGIAAGRTLQEIISVQNWNTNAVNDVSDEANQRKIYELIQLPYNYYSGLSSGATQDSKAKGTEVQITYNPIPNWTMKFTGSKSSATYQNIAPQYDEWLAERMPKWTTSKAADIPDFVDPNTNREWSLKQFWTGYGYTGVAQKENTDGNTSAEAYFNNVVVSQVSLAKALEGANSPLERKYHGSFLTNYQFTQGKFKGFSVGGSERWESKAAIGFYGKVGDPKQPQVINLADITRPIYDDGNYYTDIWFAYTRKIANDKIRMKLQLNINNATESGRLMPTQVNFDGTPWAFRIIDPRQYVLTATFEF